MVLHIVGINAAGLEGANPDITYGRVLPWLQDPDDAVWRLYGAAWRDIFLLDADGVVLDERNLTEFSLTDGANAAAYADVLRDATF